MRRPLQHPARIVPLAFLCAIAVGTVLMLLPVTREGPGGPSFVTALFTATSAISVTGLTVVDTATYWSDTGHVLILVLAQLGGFGILAMATLVSLLVSQRLGLRSRLVARAESSLALGDVGRVLGRIALTMLVCESVIAVFVAGRLWIHYDYPFGRAVWYGVFHAVQAFNNAGFALYSDSFVRFVGDWWICLPLAAGMAAGGLGFPVLFELARRLGRPANWSTHTRLTVWGGLVLAVVGLLVFLTFEWSNPLTLGPLGVDEKLITAIFQDMSTRAGGLNSLDFNAMNTETTVVAIVLMFIGGGSASTAGGIKITTFFLLAFVIWAEVRGQPDVVVGRRRIAETTQRQAITIALLGVALVTGGTLLLIALTDGLALDRALFEVTSAFATVGLSTGLTPNLPHSAQIVLIVLMFIGRVGTIAVASAIALNARTRLYRYPEERPIVG
ncbi:TrkH family potassium uptake protein [Polymorphospora lycopeni]|uniref:Potassium transporter TrkG n=1 Tax=Polymorphospora lycopeni TaxID=3140240 RepID=A0ABV5CQ83_9ACTN